MSSVLDLIPAFRPEDPVGFNALPGSDDALELVRLIRNPTGFFHERFERYGRVFKSRLVGPCVFVVGEEANRTVLITNRSEFSQGQGYGKTPVVRVFENSIMLQDGDPHMRTRGLLAPAVNRLSIRDSAERVHAIWSGAITRASYEDFVDAYDIVQRTTFDVAVNALSGLELGAQTEAYRPHFEQLIEGIMAPVNVRVPGSRLDRALDAREKLVELLDAPIRAARAAPPTGLLGQLAHHRDEDGTTLTNGEIAQHLLLLAWAGYDTTASAGSWVLHVLAHRSDWQERLRAELACVGDDFANIDTDKRLPQLDWFLLEIERMYPSALFFPRVALSDVEIHGHRIPRGTLVFYCPYMSHRDPASFEHPNSFDPDRWDPARGDKRPSPSKLYGFGGGARVCLGKAFAKMQLKLMIYSLLRDYRIDPDPRTTPSVMGLPVHHPKDSHVRIRRLDTPAASA